MKYTLTFLALLSATLFTSCASLASPITAPLKVAGAVTTTAIGVTKALIGNSSNQ